MEPRSCWMTRVSAACLAATSGCAPELNWREVRAAESGVVQLFPCKPVRQQRRVELGGKSGVFALLVCDAGGVSWAQASCDAADSVEATSVAAELLRSFSANLNARSRDPLAVGSAIRLSGQAPDGTPVEAMVLVASRGSRVVQATVLRTQRIGAADVPRRIGPGGLAPQDDQRTVQLPAEAAEAFISSLRWQ